MLSSTYKNCEKVSRYKINVISVHCIFFLIPYCVNYKGYESFLIAFFVCLSFHLCLSESSFLWCCKLHLSLSVRFINKKVCYFWESRKFVQNISLKYNTATFLVAGKVSRKSSCIRDIMLGWVVIKSHKL